jgi:hypothetical protein
VSETLSQSEDVRYCEHSESGAENLLPVIVSSKRHMPELCSDEQEDRDDTENENGTKRVLKCKSSQSKKEEDKTSKSHSKVSKTLSRRNCSRKESAGCLSASLELGRKDIKCNHCNDESLDLKMGSKRDGETSVSADGSRHDGGEGETTDDDIFYYRHPQKSSLQEKETRTNEETVCLDSQKKNARSANSRILELSVTSGHCTDGRSVFSGYSDHGAAETTHFVTGLEPAKAESNTAGSDSKSTFTTTKRKTTSSHNSVQSKHDENCHADDDSNSSNQETVLTTSKSLAGSKHKQHGYNISDDREASKSGTILPKQKGSLDPLYRLIASGYDENSGSISDDGELLNKENVLTTLQRQMRSSKRLVGSKPIVTEGGKNCKMESVPSRRKSGTETGITFGRSKYERNGGHRADDGKSTEKENVLKSRQRETERNHLIASGYDKADYTLFVSDVGYASKDESVFSTAEITGMPKHREYEYDGDVDDDDDDSYTFPKRSLFCKKDVKTGNSCNEKCVSLNSVRSNKYKRVMSNSSQSMLTRNSVPRGSLEHSIKSVVCKNENIITSHNSSDDNLAGIDSLTHSHRQKFSGNIMQKINSSHESDEDIQKMDSKLMKNRTETRNISLIEFEHIKNEEEIPDDDDDDDDDIFYKTPRRSLLCEMEGGRMSSVCANETLTCFKTNTKTNKPNKNKSSQNLSSRDNTARESHTGSFNVLTFKNKNTGDRSSISDKSFAGFQDILTGRHRLQFSVNAMEKIGCSNKSGDIHKTDMKSNLMQSSRTETQRDSSASLEHLEEKVLEHEEEDDDDDDDDDDDIFYYRIPKQSVSCRKGKNGQCQYS